MDKIFLNQETFDAIKEWIASEKKRSIVKGNSAYFSLCRTKDFINSLVSEDAKTIPDVPISGKSLNRETADAIIEEAMKATRIRSMPGFYMPFSLDKLRTILASLVVEDEASELKEWQVLTGRFASMVNYLAVELMKQGPVTGNTMNYANDAIDTVADYLVFDEEEQ